MKNPTMNFVYYSGEIFDGPRAIVIGHVRYVWGDVDIRDFLSEETIQSVEDIIIATNGGSIRVLKHSDISPRRKYQVVSEYTPIEDIKSKYILICPTRMIWSFEDLTSEDRLDRGEKYLELRGSNLKDMDILDLASNLSYMYGVKFTPHLITIGEEYTITAEDSYKYPKMWKDIKSNVKAIKKTYKLESVEVLTCNKKSTALSQSAPLFMF